MTFAADEQGPQSSRPREVYEFTLPAVTHRLASGVRDISVDGQTYRATTISREAVEVTTPNGRGALEIPVLVSHALPQRYLRNGVPPHRIDVVVRRKQLNSGEHEQVWIGRVHSMRIDGHIATFLVLSHTSSAMQGRIPTITVGRECSHVLYDAGCRVVESSFQISCTVFGVNGADVLCSSNVAFNTANWFKWGRMIHVASGEYATITEQQSNLVTLKVPMLDMQVGDSILVSAGCQHDVDTCLDKFANVVNYGGLPAKPSGNPFLPGRKLYDLKQWGID